MKSVDEHLEAVLEAVHPLEDLDLTLLDAHGCVLSEDVATQVAMPGFDNSGMDGYAVRAEDLVEATAAAPVRLPVVGDVPAGPVSPLRVEPGHCVRIMTGAPVPTGADAVVPLEWTDGGVSTVRISGCPRQGAHIRRAGEDVAAGELVATAGSYLGSSRLGLLAAANRASVRVRPSPRVVVVSTGAELVEVGSPLGPGQIPDVNSYALTAAVREAGAIAYRVGIVPDDPRSLLATLEDHLIRADMVVTSGGVSAGAYDVVKEALAGLGTVRFDSVAMKPGKPQAFGTLGPEDTPFFGLPGNPVSALVSFEVFVRPALRRMLGAEPLHRPHVNARLKTELRSSDDRREYVRAQLGVEDGIYVVTPVGGSGSHLMSGLAAANALVVLGEETTVVREGSPVTVMVLDRRSR